MKMKNYILNEEMFKKINKNVIDYCIEKNVFKVDSKEVESLNKWIKMNAKNVDKIVFYFDFSKNTLTLKQSDMLVKEIKKLEKVKALKDVEKYVHTKKGNSYYENFVVTSVCVLNAKTREEKYNYLYDSICDYLDERVVKCNACGFKDDKCEAKKNTNMTMGCCHHFKNKRFGILYEKNLMLCEHQKDKSCTAKCLTCKLYMCDFMKKKGYSFNTQNVITIKRYFNIVQKIILSTSFFTEKEKIMKKLLLFS